MIASGPSAGVSAVDTWVEAYARRLKAAGDQRRPGTWNIGTGSEVSVLELARIISGLAGRPLQPRFAPQRPGELQRSALAAGRARRDLGWTATTTLRDGIAAVYRWIEAGAADRAPC